MDVIDHPRDTTTRTVPAVLPFSPLTPEGLAVAIDTAAPRQAIDFAVALTDRAVAELDRWL